VRVVGEATRGCEQLAGQGLCCVAVGITNDLSRVSLPVALMVSCPQVAVSAFLVLIEF